MCTAEPAGATIAPDTGRTRTLTHSVPAGTNVLVRVTCTSDTQTGTAVARFTANPDPATTDCDSSLDTFSAAGTPVRGTISSDDGCTSVRRRPNNSSVYHARRHFLRLTSPGWVTVTLESAASNPQRLDTYLILLRGDAGQSTHCLDLVANHGTARWWPGVLPVAQLVSGVTPLPAVVASGHIRGDGVMLNNRPARRRS